MILRPYQKAAVDSVYAHLNARADNPCVVVPTGGGKTPIMATICSDVAGKWQGRVCVLAHVKELLEQTAKTLNMICPELFPGVYSAGLKRRDTDNKVIVAGIQSVYKRACELGKFDIIIVDEAHLIPPDGEGMYQQFLTDAKIINPNVRLVGMTATPYRMKSGVICAEDHLLNAVCFEVGVKELIRDGYLSPLISKAGKTKVDMSELHVRMGEFITAETTALMDTKAIVSAACNEILNYTKDRKSCLIFACSIAHAEHVAEYLRGYTDSVEVICANTLDVMRAGMLNDFKTGTLKYIVNVNVLTTGFDAPNVDCVALLRPTKSPGLYYQMVGRGFRLCEGKVNCLILDYGGNIMRHGPVDAIRPMEARKGKGKGGDAPVKECPACNSVIATGYSACPDCGYVFPETAVAHDTTASEADIISEEAAEPIDEEVRDVTYSIHMKRGADENHPKTLRVDYYITGLNSVSEWVCPEHTGYARNKFITWWKDRCKEPVPDTASDAMLIGDRGLIKQATKIRTVFKSGSTFASIIGYDLPDEWPSEFVPEPVVVEKRPSFCVDDEYIPF